MNGELDLDDNYLMRYKRVIRKNGCENEVQEIIDRSTYTVEQRSESHLANREIQGDEKRRKQFERFMLLRNSKIKHELFLEKEYSRWTSEQKVQYWYGRLQFQNKMQSEVTKGIGNFGLYIMNRKAKEKLLKYEENWEGFLKKYCVKFGIPIQIVRRLFELNGNEEEWKLLAKKVGYVEGYWNKE